MEISDFFYTEGETAKSLGVSRITVWKWIKDGRFSVQRIGREVLIPKWEVEVIREIRTR